MPKDIEFARRIHFYTIEVWPPVSPSPNLYQFRRKLSTGSASVYISEALNLPKYPNCTGYIQDVHQPVLKYRMFIKQS